MKSDALIESKALRESYINRLNVLDKVKKLTLLPDDMNASIEMVATFYEVGDEAIRSCIKDNRGELESDGLKVLTGNEFTGFVKSFKDLAIISNMARSFTIIPRQAILRIGMLLRDSLVARSVRDYLLDTEAESPTRKKVQAHDDEGKRLEREIKLKNARVREANILLKVADLDTTEPTYRKVLRSKAVEVVAGERLLPMPKVERATYTATQAAEKLGMSSAKAAGTLANRLGLKPPEGEKNNYGEWEHSKSQYGPKQVKQFMYTDAGIEAMRLALEEGR
ncbi:hypothetical protein [Paenibacillus massiliensis]|uniref:hypothetical protein n=1 Tax=Paenibacillus massiliensis TaxID=225917 RepID=UPI000472B94B|nr:hypothetical protein [Paenibacillus massiliensis]